MARRGRKAKAVKREANGRASRKGLPRVTFDVGTDRARIKIEMYGTDGTDAIGRARVHGLLGEDGDAIRDTARKVARAYWPMLEVGTYRCTLSDSASGFWREQSEADKRREEWLTDTLRKVDRMGRAHRRAFDDLVIDIHPDSGPAWLDEIIWHRLHKREIPVLRQRMLDMAMEAIAEIMR
jgi:hypothetical protein